MCGFVCACFMNNAPNDWVNGKLVIQHSIKVGTNRFIQVDKLVDTGWYFFRVEWNVSRLNNLRQTHDPWCRCQSNKTSKTMRSAFRQTAEGLVETDIMYQDKWQWELELEWQWEFYLSLEVFASIVHCWLWEAEGADTWTPRILTAEVTKHYFGRQILLLLAQVEKVKNGEWEWGTLMRFHLRAGGILDS